MSEREGKMETVQPIILWPFQRPSSPQNLISLFDFFADLQGGVTAEPTLVINHFSKTWINSTYQDILARVAKHNWDIRWVWSVDTCQMWLDGFAASHSACVGRFPGGARPNELSSAPYEHCVHMLIPGDFHYAQPAGKVAMEVLARAMQHLSRNPPRVSLGQLQVSEHRLKHLVDAFGTWQLLAHWFPDEEVLLRTLTTRPRSEFLTLSGEVLNEALYAPWMPYEQTLVLLLREAQLGSCNLIKVFDFGPLEEDEPVYWEHEPTAKYNEAITQIERIETVLRVHWRERQQMSHELLDKYQWLAHQSNLLVQKQIADMQNAFFRSGAV